jgi:hypothetical protein
MYQTSEGAKQGVKQFVDLPVTPSVTDEELTILI